MGSGFIYIFNWERSCNAGDTGMLTLRHITDQYFLKKTVKPKSNMPSINLLKRFWWKCCVINPPVLCCAQTQGSGGVCPSCPLLRVCPGDPVSHCPFGSDCCCCHHGVGVACASGSCWAIAPELLCLQGSVCPPDVAEVTHVPWLSRVLVPMKQIISFQPQCVSLPGLGLLPKMCIWR